MTAALRSMLWFASAVLLTVLVSGAPQCVTTLLGFEDCCSTECEGSFGTKQCPPNCAQGHCAKMLPSFVAINPPMPLQQSLRVGVPSAPFEPRLSVASLSIFHPPRA